MNEVEKMMQDISVMMHKAATYMLTAEVVYTAVEIAKENPDMPADVVVAKALNEWDVD